MTAKVNISLRIDARAIEEADRHVEWMREHHGVEITRSDALRRWSPARTPRPPE